MIINTSIIKFIDILIKYFYGFHEFKDFIFFPFCHLQKIIVQFATVWIVPLTMDPKENRFFIKFHNFISNPKKVVKLIVLSICTIVVIFQVK